MPIYNTDVVTYSVNTHLLPRTGNLKSYPTGYTHLTRESNLIVYTHPYFLYNRVYINDRLSLKPRMP